MNLIVIYAPALHHTRHGLRIARRYDFRETGLLKKMRRLVSMGGMSEVNFWKRLERLAVADLEDLKESGEREKSRLDLKSFDLTPEKKLFEVSKVADDLCAMANAGGGRLIYGAKDDGADGIEGFYPAPIGRLKAARSTLANAAHAVSPTPMVEVKDLRYPDEASEKFLLVVEVKPAAGGPHQHAGKYLTRGADANSFMPHSSVVQAVLAQHGSRDSRWGAALDPGRRMNSNALKRNSDRKSGWWVSLRMSPSPRSLGLLVNPVGEEVAELEKLLKASDWQTNCGQVEIFATKDTGAIQEVTFSFLGDAKWEMCLGQRPGVLAFKRKIAAKLMETASCLSRLCASLDVSVDVCVMAYGQSPSSRFCLVEEINGEEVTHESPGDGSSHFARCWGLRSLGELREEPVAEEVAAELVKLLTRDLERLGSLFDD